MDPPRLGFVVLIVVLWCILLTGAAGAQSVRLVEAWTLAEGLNRPESVVYDAERNALYVSNINGDGTAKDGNGYITKVSPNGAILEAQWVAQLHAPKGLALYGDKLYAADIDALIEIDVSTGAVTGRFPAAGATFLNDVTVDAAGTVYVSDSRASMLYKLAGDSLTMWLQDDRIAMPNGVYAEEDRLVVAAGDSRAENPGGARYLQAVAYETQAIALLKDAVPLGSLDAVAPDGQGGYFLTDWGAGKVLHFTPEEGATLLAQLGQGTADLDYAADEGMLFLPVMMSDQLIAYRVEWSQ